jgi:hypothetical protein
MIIGGSDIIIEAPPRVPLADLIIARVRLLWPDSWFQDAEDDEARPMRDPRVVVRGGRSREFFIYRDRASFDEWERYGATPSNMNTMLHFILPDNLAGDNELQTFTMVCGERTAEVEQLARDLDQSFRYAWSPAAA